MTKEFYLFSNSDWADFKDFLNTNRSKLVDIKFDGEPENETITVEVLD